MDGGKSAIQILWEYRHYLHAELVAVPQEGGHEEANPVMLGNIEPGTNGYIRFARRKLGECWLHDVDGLRHGYGAPKLAPRKHAQFHGGTFITNGPDES